MSGCSGGGGGGGNPGAPASGPAATANAGLVATLAWDSPTTNEDGSEIAGDLSGYRIYYGTASRDYTRIIDVGRTNGFTVTGLNAARYFFTVTAYDFWGNESVFSDEVSVELR